MNLENDVINIDRTDSILNSIVGNHQLVLVEFKARWSGACQIIAPIMEQLRSDYINRVRFFMVDIDENRELAGIYGINNIPTLLFFRNGQLTDSIRGAVSRKVLKEKIEGMLLGFNN